VSELAFAPAVTLLGALDAGEVSSRELLDLYLERIGKLNPELNAVVTLDEEGARATATAADEARGRDRDGRGGRPLLGLPITIKDSLETAGMRTTSGASELSGHVPAADAPAVARLRAAGAVIMGKTNLPAWTADVQTTNALFGTTVNPWDPARSPGGSSGGSAAALAAGLSALELGSDIGGSVRIPSHWCGVCGHKPSWGVIPLRGHIPPRPGSLAPTDLGVLGPMARTAADLALAVGVLAGPDEADARAWRLELPPPRHERIDGYRVAVWFDDPDCPVAGEVMDVLETAVAALAGAGAVISRPGDARPPVTLAGQARPYQRLLQAVMGAGLPQPLFAGLVAVAEGAEASDDREHVRFARDVTARMRDWHPANEQRHRTRAAWAEFFRHHDVLLTPVAPTVAIPHDHRPVPERHLTVDGQPRPYWDLIAWPSLANFAGLPATVVPAGISDSGLPVGIQILGPYLEDRTTLAFAGHVETVLGGFRPPPALRVLRTNRC